MCENIMSIIIKYIYIYVAFKKKVKIVQHKDNKIDVRVIRNETLLYVLKGVRWVQDQSSYSVSESLREGF